VPNNQAILKIQNPKPISLCIVSDYTVTSTFYAFHKVVIQYIKTLASDMRKIWYLNEGTVSQYKNTNNFANLVSHNNDSGIPAKWHFFATSNGKSSFHVVDCTAKQQAAKASLQCP
jgi:hypothetical protein